MSSKVSGITGNIWDHVWETSEIPDPLRNRYNNIESAAIGRIVSRFPIEGGLVLEAGCGSGQYSVILAAKGAHVIGLDFSKKAIATAILIFRKSAIRNVDFIIADIKSLPFKNDCIDLVWNEGVLEHFQRVTSHLIFDEMVRVTKPQGIVAVFAPCSLSFERKLWKSFLVYRRRWPYGYEKPYHPTELRSIFLEHDLRIHKCSGVQAFFFLDFLIRSISHRVMRRYFNLMASISEKIPLNRLLGSQIFCFATRSEITNK